MKMTWETGLYDMGNQIYCYVTNGAVMMSNCCMVVGEDVALVFDVLSTKSETEKFLEACRKYTDKPIKYLVLSHCHGDHFLGRNALGDVTIISHESVKEAIKLDSERNKADPLKIVRSYPHMDFTDRAYPRPDIMITGQKNYLKIDLGKREVILKHAGCCHTPGDVFMYVPDANFFAMGDILFHFVAPVTTIGDLDNWTDTLQQVYSLNPDKLLPGHGPICEKDALLELKKYLETVKKIGIEMALGQRELKDEVPCLEEQEIIALGWKETSRLVMSAEQYASKIKGEKYVTDMDRVHMLNTLRETLGEK